MSEQVSTRGATPAGNGQHRPLKLEWMYGTEAWRELRPLFARLRARGHGLDPEGGVEAVTAGFKEINRHLRQLPPARRETVRKQLDGFGLSILWELDKRGAPATLAELDGPAEPAEVAE